MSQTFRDYLYLVRRTSSQKFFWEKSGCRGWVKKLSHRRILASGAPALRQHCKVNPTVGQLFYKHCRWMNGRRKKPAATSSGGKSQFLTSDSHSTYERTAIGEIDAILRLWDTFVPQKLITSKGVWPWGTQIRLFGVQKTYFRQVNFHFFQTQIQHFSFPACWEMGTSHNGPISRWHQGVCDSGAFKPDNLESTKPICRK